MSNLHNDINKLSDTTYVLTGADVVIQIQQPNVFESTDQKAVQVETDKEKVSYMPTNANDDMPNQLMNTVRSNEIFRTSLQRICQLVYGDGLVYGKMVKQPNRHTVFEQTRDVDVDNFFAENNVQAQVEEMIHDIVHLGHTYAFFGLNNAKGKALKIVQYEHLEAYFSRLAELNEDGKIPYHLYAKDWSKRPVQNVSVTSLLDIKKPYNDILTRTGLKPVLNGKKMITNDTEERAFVVMVRAPQPGSQYYPEPAYVSAIKSGWVQVAAQIPQYKLAVMANQVNLDYHIELHHSYFDAIFKKEGITEKDKQEARKEEEINKLNELYKGYKKAGKNLVSMYHTTPDGKVEYSMIKIHKIDKSNPTQTVVDSQESAAFLYTAVGLHPALVGVLPGMTANNLSNGSEKRELSNMYQFWFKSVRDAITRTLDIVKMYNGWDNELVFRFPYFVQTTLNEGTEAKQTA